MYKLKATLKFLFLIMPFVFCVGLGLIFLYNRRILFPYFESEPIPEKSQKEIEKEMFVKFMKRVTKG